MRPRRASSSATRRARRTSKASRGATWHRRRATRRSSGYAATGASKLYSLPRYCVSRAESATLIDAKTTKLARPYCRVRRVGGPFPDRRVSACVTPLWDVAISRHCVADAEGLTKTKEKKFSVVGPSALIQGREWLTRSTSYVDNNVIVTYADVATQSQNIKCLDILHSKRANAVVCFIGCPEHRVVVDTSENPDTCLPKPLGKSACATEEVDGHEASPSRFGFGHPHEAQRPPAAL